MTTLAVIPADLVFAVEPFDTAYRDAGQLLGLHWIEVAKNKQLLTVNPDEDLYRRGDERKVVLTVTARHQGQLVGYYVWFLFAHPHYRHVKVAETDLFFLAPEHRTGLNGYRFIKAACRFAQEAGARLLTVRFKVDKDHPELMKRLGFAPTDITYTKAVGGD